MYELEKKYDLAIKDLTTLIGIDKKHSDIVLSRGNCYFALGRYKEAISDYSLCLSRGHKDVDPYLMRAKAYEKLGMKKLAEKDRKSAMVDDFELDY